MYKIVHLAHFVRCFDLEIILAMTLRYVFSNLDLCHRLKQNKDIKINSYIGKTWPVNIKFRVTA